MIGWTALVGAACAAEPPEPHIVDLVHRSTSSQAEWQAVLNDLAGRNPNDVPHYHCLVAVAALKLDQVPTSRAYRARCDETAVLGDLGPYQPLLDTWTDEAVRDLNVWAANQCTIAMAGMKCTRSTCDHCAKPQDVLVEALVAPRVPLQRIP